MTLNFMKNSSHLQIVNKPNLKPTLSLTIPLSPSSLPKMVSCLRQSGADMQPLLKSIQDAEKVFQNEMVMAEQKRLKSIMKTQRQEKKEKVKEQCQSYADFVKNFKKEESVGAAKAKQEKLESPESPIELDAEEVQAAVAEFLEKQENGELGSQADSIQTKSAEKLDANELDRTHTDAALQTPEITNL